MKKLLFLIIFLYQPFSVFGEVIFAVGGVEPRLTWRSLVQLENSTIYFKYFNDNWEYDIYRNLDNGRNVSVFFIGAESVTGITRLIKAGIKDAKLFLINPSDIPVPNYLDIIKYPDINNKLPDCLKKSVIKSEISFLMKGCNFPLFLPINYSYYWGKRYIEIPGVFYSSDYLKNSNNLSEYGGKIIVFSNKRKIIVKSNVNILHLPVPGKCFFIQEQFTDYFIATIKAYIKED